MPNLPRAWGPTPGNPRGTPNQGIPKPTTKVTIKTTKTTKGTPPAVAPQPPEDPVMSVFRSTLNQMRSLQTPVDEAKIRAPFQATGETTQHLGDAWAGQAQATGDTALRDYTGVRDAARQRGNAWATSAGAPVAPEPTTDPNSQMIVNLTQAEVGAAHGAAAAWRDMLERAGGAAVSAAQLRQTEQNSQNEQQLAASLPGAYQARDTLAFQKQSAADNTAYLNATLTEKQRARMQADATTRRGQDKRAGTAAAGVTAADRRLAKTIKDHERHDDQTQKGLNTRAKKAAANGKLQGMPQVLAALKIAKPSKTKTGKGWKVAVRNIDPATGQGYGDAHTQIFGDARYANQGGGPDGVPATFEIVGTPQPNMVDEQTPSAGMTLEQWNRAAGILWAANKSTGMTPEMARQTLQRITPKPPR